MSFKNQDMSVMINGLPLPQSISQLIALGKWSKPSSEEVFKSVIKPYLNEDILAHVKDFQFYKVEMMELESRHLLRWIGTNMEIFALGKNDKNYPPGDIEPSKTLLIGDFGYGLDTAIALDYRNNLSLPRVLIAYRGRNPLEDTRWLMLAKDINVFLKSIGLK